MARRGQTCRMGLICLAWCLLAAPAAGAAMTIHVRTDQDVSSALGDMGDCRGPDQTCSLRQALAAAQSGDTVALPADIYQLTQNQILIMMTSGVTLSGAGARTTIIKELESNLNVLNIGSGVTATVRGVTITGGHTAADFGGGGIASFGSLTLQNSTVTGNEADGHVVSDPQLGNFYVPGQGGGISENGGPLTIIDSTISGNHAEPGTGSGAQGGGIYSVNPVKLVNSTVAGNTADGSSSAPGAAEGFGGGIYMGANPSAGLTLASATIALNAATGVSGGHGGNVAMAGSGAATSVKNSIIAGGSAATGQNCDGILQSGGYNLEDQNTCGLNAVGDHVLTDAKLGQLGSHGGPTDTVPLLSGSPAINGGDPAGCADPSNVVIVIDQRGIARPQGARCDIGALEFRVPKLAGRPRISGKPQVGQRLTCLLPAVQSQDGALTRDIAWLANQQPVGSARTYLVKPADAGHALRCRLRAVNPAGSVSATSTAVTVRVPATVTITSADVKRRTATFGFLTHHATGAQCALAKGSAALSFSACRSPKSYTGLTKGSYTFAVRAVGPGGTSASARHSFRIV